MPITKDMLIKHFSDRFLKLEEGTEIGSIADILDLPILSLKDASAEDAANLENMGLTTIRELSQAKPAKMDEIIASGVLDQTTLKKFFIAAKLISRAWQKRSAYAKKEVMKVVVVGLDNAGKTTLIDLLSGKKLSEIINQMPTTMVNQVNLSTQQTNIVVWDFGGQIQHREAYLQNPEEYFLGLDLVLFVIDSQEATRYEEALGYFAQLVEIISFLGETPYFLVLLHKADPELREDPDFQINLEYLDGKVREMMAATNFSVEVVHSSIYSTYHSQPELVGVLKEMFNANQVTDANVMLLDAMMKLTDIMVEIGNRIMQALDGHTAQFAMLDSKLTNLQIAPAREPASAKKARGPVVKPPPPPPQVRTQLASEASMPEGADRGEIMNELKELFKKKGLTQRDE
jgi:GTPase Era involved in 16S rRNA processing